EAKEQRRPDFDRRIDEYIDPRRARWRPLQPLVSVLDHDDGSVDHRPDRNGNAAEAHDVGADPDRAHDVKSDQHADRQHDDRDEGAAGVQQKDHADQRDDNALLEERVFQCVDRAIDQARPVVYRQNLDTFREAAGDLSDLGLDVLDDREGVFAVAMQYDAADDLAFP